MSDCPIDGTVELKTTKRISVIDGNQTVFREFPTTCISSKRYYINLKKKMSTSTVNTQASNAIPMGQVAVMAQPTPVANPAASQMPVAVMIPVTKDEPQEEDE